jgi:hypothetical protein
MGNIVTEREDDDDMATSWASISTEEKINFLELDGTVSE